MMATRDIDSLYPASLNPQTGADIRIRHAYGGNPKAIEYSSRYGLLNDDSRLAPSIEGPAHIPGNQSISGTGYVKLKAHGGKTPSDPGAHNWETLARNVGRASTGLKEVAKTGINLALDRIQGVDPTSMASADFRTHMDNRFKTTTYSNVMRISRNQYRTQTKAAAELQAQDAARQAEVAAKEADDLQTSMRAHSNMLDPKMNYGIAYKEAAAKGTNAKKRRSPSSSKPKAKRPTPSTPVNLNDPSNW